MATELETLLRESRPALVRFLARMVGEADAEDVTQTVMANAARAFSGFRGDSSPRTWLYRIATNAGRDLLRSRVAPASEAEATDATDELPDTSDQASQERRLLREEMNRCVAGLLDRLPESYRTVLALSDCEELSDAEIADIMGVSVGAAKIRLHRARARLKEELERCCSFYRDERSVLCCDRKET